MANVTINGNFHLLKKDGISPFEFERYKEYRNKWHKNPKNRIIEDFPIHLDIEVTASCNIRCPFCITTHAKFQKGMMDLDLYKKIIDEGSKKGLYSIKLNWRGEPLLHKKLPEMVSFAKEKGIVDVFTNTNATLLTKEKSKALIDAGMDRLVISFEGFEKEIYESNRVGAKFEKVLNNITEFMNLKKEMGISLPWVRVQTILIDELKNKEEEYSKFWTEIVDEVACIDMKNEVERFKVGKNEWVCPQLWQRLTIAWDGTIMPCVNDHFGKMSIGNANKDSISQIWKNHIRLKEMRNLHIQGNGHQIEGCLDCPLRSAQVIKEKGNI